MIKSDLPAFSIAADVNRRLQESACLVVTAPPGAGKSTILPLTILGFSGGSGSSGLSRVSGSSGKIIMLEPRRIAARAVAERMAELLGERVGETVGYRVRFEKCVSAKTRIEVVTEGILTRMLIDDPTLDGIACIIFDEFHERSIHSDVALALTREAQQLLRPDLRIVIMSATIDAEAICTALATASGPAPLIESEGRMFPVEIRLNDQTATAANCVEMAAAAVRLAVEKHEGDILVFLPGEGEIRQCGELLDRTLPGCITPFFGVPSAQTCTPPIGGGWRGAYLFGNLPLSEQRKAILPSADGMRKIVLATNIAETSLTIEGVRVVIDTGLCRTMVFDAQSGLSRLETTRISLDMATQRSGRAGRVAEGVCYRLWTMATEHRMAAQRTAEILTADLAPMVLDIAAWGESEVERLPWLTPPPRAAVVEAVGTLRNLKALDVKGSDATSPDATNGKNLVFSLTDHGRALAKMPTHPRIAQMLLTARTAADKALAADVAALLEERDPMVGEVSADLCLRIDLLRRNRKRLPRVARIAEQYRRLVHADEDNAAPAPTAVGALIAAAYPERIAKAHADGCGRFVMATGDNARLEQTDDLTAYDWIAVASYNAGSGRIFLAAPLDTADLAPIIYIKDNVTWDTKNGCLVARREERVGSLVVASRPLSDLPSETVVDVICEAARRRGESMLDFAADAVVALQNRVAALAAWHPELDLPDLSTAAVLSRVEEWLPLYLGMATNPPSIGGSWRGALKRIDLAEALTSLLSYEQQQSVERLAPTHITVPTGSRIRLEYRPAAEAPVLRVRLQECFGMQDTPRVDDGRQPVLMELLSPGFKPVQLTKDLRSFWTTTYFDVRKELRRRYPKHHWPDNPLEAAPVRGVKRKTH